MFNAIELGFNHGSGQFALLRQVQIEQQNVGFQIGN